MLHIHCKTPVAMLLAGVPDEKGILRFPEDTSPLPGLALDVPPLTPINDLLFQELEKVFGESVRTRAKIHQEFAETLPLPDGRDATLYLASVDGPFETANEWRSLPEIMRALPKDRGRLPYLKAWQLLAGGLVDPVKAIETDDILGKLLKGDEPLS